MNLQRVFVAIVAFIILGLVILVILQNRMIEKFSMILEQNTKVTGEDLDMKPDMDQEECSTACKNNPACFAANMNQNGNICWLKSTAGNRATDSKMSSLRFPVELYDQADFKGKGLGLDVGKYNLKDLQAKGYADNTLQSIRVRDGYRIKVYENDGRSGASASFITSQPNLGVVLDRKSNKWSNRVSSVLIEAV